MAQQTDISSILAALANAGAQGSTPAQPPLGQVPPPAGMPQGYPGAPASAPPAITPIGLPGYPPPQPSSSGTFDLGNLKPSASGSLNLSDVKPSTTGTLPINFQDALNRARGRAAEMGVTPSQGSRQDPRLPGRQSYRPRSRSNSPRRDSYDDYNPYRDERRESRRANGYQRERSRSRSPPRGRGDTFSPSSARNYTRDRSPRRDDTETIPIESNVVGLVIGRQGENLRRIEKETQTRIQFITGPDQTGPRRQCRIQGPARNRADAIREINRIIEENRLQKEMGRSGGGDNRQQGRASQQQQEQQQPLREGENSTQIMVPDKTVGLIIGRGGETIRDLQERSGCHINILGENRSTNGLRPVNLIGNAQSAQLAQELIMEIVESDTRNGNGQATGRDAPRVPPSAQYTPADAGKESQTIHVPSEAVGMIIGKGGETIKEMQNSTGCKINVSQPSGADREREIGLIGTRHAIEDAKRIIWDKVDAVAQRDRRNANNHGGGGRRDDNYGDRYSHSQQPSYGQQPPAMPMQGSMPPGVAPAAAPAAGGEDPYAPYGGYANYVALWWASAMAQQGANAGQPGAPPPGGPPGAPGA